jgi:hydroxymethylpyrimidine pyrophosphatase-like HAD family hydrolase
MHAVSQKPVGRAGRRPIGGPFTTIACDADGTLTLRHQLAGRTAAALVRWREAGGRIILVTGEVRDDLMHLARTGLFDRVVGENGGIILRPPSWRADNLGPRPPLSLVRALRGRVEPLTVGRVMLTTEDPHERALRAAIRDLGLDCDVIRNRKNLMALPAGVNKATGLGVALDDLGLDPGGVVTVGDAENDMCWIGASGLCVAVANAVPALRAKADWVTIGRGPDGMIELIRRLLGGKLTSRSKHRA